VPHEDSELLLISKQIQLKNKCQTSLKANQISPGTQQTDCFQFVNATCCSFEILGHSMNMQTLWTIDFTIFNGIQQKCSHVT